MKKLLLIFLFGTMAYAQPNINPPMDLFVCQMDSGGGMSYFNLTVNDMVMLAGLDASQYNVTYHETQAEAVNAQNAISNPTDYSSASNVIYARVTEIANTTNYVVAAFNLMVSPLPVVPNLPAIEQCGSMFDLTINSNLIEGPVDVSYHVTLSDAETGTNAMVNPQSYFSETSALVWVRVSNNAGCYIIKEQQLIIIAGQFEVSVEFDAQTITFVAAPEGDYEYSLDGIDWQVSPNFYNIAYGTHTGQVKNICGTTVAITIELTPMTPTGASEQTFTEGSTLADVEVEGENIQWYDNDGEGMPDFPNGTSQPLPLSTLLVDGETYYASQTINGVESTQRLAVTVNLILGNDDFIFNGLRYYPNPANSVLNIENTTEINSVSIVNALGQKVITKTVNGNAVQVDVSSLSKGIYFVTVNSGNASKTVKIIKE